LIISAIRIGRFMLAFRNSVNFTPNDAARRVTVLNDRARDLFAMGCGGVAAHVRRACSSFRRRSSARFGACLKADHKRLCSAEMRYLRVHTDVAKGLQWAETNALEVILPNY
jgi:hypothetical protein